MSNYLDEFEYQYALPQLIQRVRLSFVHVRVDTATSGSGMQFKYRQFVPISRSTGKRVKKSDAPGMEFSKRVIHFRQMSLSALALPQSYKIKNAAHLSQKHAARSSVQHVAAAPVIH